MIIDVVRSCLWTGMYDYNFDGALMSLISSTAVLILIVISPSKH